MKSASRLAVSRKSRVFQAKSMPGRDIFPYQCGGLLEAIFPLALVYDA